MGKRVLYVATVVKTHIMHFHIPYLKMFKEEGWHTAVAARNDYENPSECNIPYCDEYIDIAFERSPLKLANLKAYQQLKRVIDEGNYDIVHCHTPVAAMLTRLAARKARKRGTKVFYTAHGYHFFKGAPLRNWLIYFPVEWVCSFMTDTLITINGEDYALAKKYMHARQIEYAPGVGIDIDRCMGGRLDRANFRSSIGVPPKALMLLSVGELNKNKNHQCVIRALAYDKCSNFYYVIAGTGSQASKLKSLAEKLKIGDRVKMLGYRQDVHDLLTAADIFCFPSYREGLSVSLMEAMGHKLPCIVSRIRGNVDLIDDNGGRMFAPCSVDELIESLVYVLSADREKMGQYNYEHVQIYAIKNVMRKMKRLYAIE